MCTADDSKPVDINNLRAMAGELRSFLDSRGFGVTTI